MKVSRRVSRVSVLAASAALLLSSCSQNAPGVAADVDGSRITDAQVDEFAQVLCALNTAPGQAQTGVVATRAIRTTALSVLLDIELAGKVADVGAVDPTAVAQTVAQNEATSKALPAKLRPVFDNAVQEYAAAQLAVTELGRQKLTEQGSTGTIDSAAALAEGSKARTALLSSDKVTIDPRFGSVVDGVLTPGSGSLSVPVSKNAVAGAKAQPSTTWLNGLPANQTCS